MVEPVITTIGAALAVRWAGRKLLGPVCDEIGQGLADSYSHRRLRNLNRIGIDAQAKLGSRIDADGLVPPRVAWRVFEEGSWCDEPVMAEYFGGILAASRSSTGTNDRAVAWAGVVSRLSADEIYLHYLAYDAFRRLYAGRDLHLGDREVRLQLQVLLPEAELAEVIQPALELDVGLLYGLKREGLVDAPFGIGDAASLAKHLNVRYSGPGRGLVFVPSVPGMELFIWAHGHHLRFDTILDEAANLDPVEALGSVTGAQQVREW